MINKIIFFLVRLFVGTTLYKETKRSKNDK